MDLDTYGKNGGLLGGHTSRSEKYGIPLSTGSLGHGLPFALGIAYEEKISQSKSHTPIFVIMSDGEMNEGTTWESALIGNHLELNNLIVIIDRNNLQSFTTTEKTLAINPLADKWKAFGWDVVEVNGHNVKELIEQFQTLNKPKVIIANTIKGKGISFMSIS